MSKHLDASLGKEQSSRMEKSRSRILFGLRVLGALFVVFLAWKFFRVGYGYGVEAWSSARAFSFLKDWLPAVVGVMVGVVPGSEWEHKMKTRYRISIVIVGFIYSGILYRSQTLSDTDSTKQLRDAIGSAVTQANAHSDEQFGKVTDKVDGVDGKVSKVGSALADTATALSADIQRTADAIQKTSDRLDTSIGKVGKPDPPIPAKLVFSLYEVTATIDKPALYKTVAPDQDGNYAVNWTFANSSESTADSIDVWIRVCDKCSFVKEPPGFEKTAGSDERVRHRMFGSINPGVSFEKMNLLVKSEATDGYFQVAFRYSCKTCGGKIGPDQVATIVEAIPPRP